MIRRFAAAAAALTVVLIVAGGVVTNTDSGLACPDWPTCFGTVAPKMVGNVAVEHTHRLLATLVGLLSIGIVVLALPRRLWLGMAGCCILILGASFWAGHVKHTQGVLPPAGILLVLVGYAGCAAVIARARDLDGKLAAGALALVMFQGLLGGLTVLYRLPTLVLVMHLATSMLFLSLTTHLASRGRAVEAARGPLWLTAAAIYAQIVLGATVRHTGAGLVCGVDVLSCRGALWPVNVHPMVHLHMLHRTLALVVAGLVLWSSLRLARESTGRLKAFALAAQVLVLAQIALGILTVTTFKAIVPLTSHLLVAALLLADYVVLLSWTRAPATAPARATLQVAA